MKVLTIVGGRPLSPADGLHGERKDVLVCDGRIGEVADHIEPQGEVIDAAGAYVAPGFIDIHTHCYPKAFLGLDPDVLGLEREATTILDAGSSGAATYEDFLINTISHADTKVFALLNVSKEGLLYGHELNDPKKVDLGLVREVVAEHRGPQGARLGERGGRRGPDPHRAGREHRPRARHPAHGSHRELPACLYRRAQPA